MNNLERKIEQARAELLAARDAAYAATDPVTKDAAWKTWDAAFNRFNEAYTEQQNKRLMHRLQLAERLQR